MTPPPPLTSARLARYFAWAWLWLMKYAVFLVEGSPEARRHLHLMARTITRLALARAVKRFASRRAAKFTRPPSAPPGFVRRRKLKPKHMVRAAIGSALRRRFRGRSAGARFAALINALFELDALVDRLAKRIARRLTRICPLVAVRPPADSLASRVCAPAPLCADTS